MICQQPYRLISESHQITEFNRPLSSLSSSSSRVAFVELIWLNIVYWSKSWIMLRRIGKMMERAHGQWDLTDQTITNVSILRGVRRLGPPGWYPDWARIHWGRLTGINGWKWLGWHAWPLPKKGGTLLVLQRQCEGTWLWHTGSSSSRARRHHWLMPLKYSHCWLDLLSTVCSLWSLNLRGQIKSQTHSTHVEPWSQITFWSRS